MVLVLFTSLLVILSMSSCGWKVKECQKVGGQILTVEQNGNDPYEFNNTIAYLEADGWTCWDK